jgi:tetratricopeptide (TPR) repeat protein
MAPKNKDAKEKKKFAKIQEQKNKESKAHLETGMGFMEKANYAKAIPAFTTSIEVNPENVEAYFQQGKAYKEQKEYDKAIADFSKTIELAPNHAEAYSLRGNCYDVTEQYDLAIQDFTGVIELFPDDDHAYNMRGNARQAKRIPGLKLKNAEFAAVISDFTCALDLNPNNYYTYCNRASAYFDRQEFRSAIADYTSAIQIKVDYVYAYLRRGVACYQCVLHEEKLGVLKEEEAKLRELEAAKASGQPTSNPNTALNKKSEDLMAFWEKEFKEIIAKEKKDRERMQLLQNAINDFTIVLSFDDQDPQAYLHRIKVYEMLGMTDKARDDRNKMIEIEVKQKKP